VTIEQLTAHEGNALMKGNGGRKRAADLMRSSALFIVACGFVGCGDHDEPPGMTKQAVTFDEVPEDVRAAASKAIPQVKFKEAWKNLDREGKLHSYEIRGKNPADGRIREARVSTKGEILEME
jgi:hypothetical protein